MPISTPFHSRTAERCVSMRYKDWAGYYAVCSYDTCHEREYYALRHAAGLIDVTPLYKYDVTGPDAARFLARVMVRNIESLKLGQVTYCCWCDQDGKVVDDGTVSRLGESHYRVTSAEPAFAWLSRFSTGYDLSIVDTSESLGALSLQGPNSRAILRGCCDAAVDDLRFFRLTEAKLNSTDVIITRTGYTGDLGFEIWVDRERAVAVWDALMSEGQAYGLLPAGLDAMDVTRVEAGFILNGVDYFSAPRCMIDARKSTPYELGLGWTVQLNRDSFNGQTALLEEAARGSRLAFVGLEIDWDAFERLFAEHNLPPELSTAAWREAVPVYNNHGGQIGQATSGAWSPILKKNLALATVDVAYQEIGTELRIEVTVEYQRRTVPAIVCKRPFFDPPRKRD